MQIDYISLNRLSVSKANMRQGKKPPDVTDILPSIIKRGVISPLFVRPNCNKGHYEIVAGKRCFYTSLEAAKQGKDDITLPCITLSEDDDAEALEISMIENMLRQSPDQVTQWESYTRLVKEGRSVEDISATFALTELQVKRILALGNLLPRIREAYRAEEIDATTVKHLTLATKAQQKAWLALFDDADSYAPRGNQLKGWLFGGASISVDVALFDLDAFNGQIVNQIGRRLTGDLQTKLEQSRLLMMFDEFPALGRLDFFESALAFMAGYGIKSFLIAQSLNQIERVYGKNNAILDNCHVRVAFATNDEGTAKRVSESLGTAAKQRSMKNYAGHRLSPWLGHLMISRSKTSRPLLTQGEILQLPDTDEIVMLSGSPPIKARKAHYYADLRLQARISASGVSLRCCRMLISKAPSREFDFAENGSSDANAASAERLRIDMTRNARQVSLDPGDGIEL